MKDCHQDALLDRRQDRDRPVLGIAAQASASRQCLAQRFFRVFLGHPETFDEPLDGVSSQSRSRVIFLTRSRHDRGSPIVWNRFQSGLLLIEEKDN